MPLTRYEIRNEYSLADPELYRAADKDDPEALLEGVSMAGLVGVLRQLGDLAEFAAEIFHDLHEEVMVTAARGHGLTVRVQQLEAEVPPIERAFLSKTNHTPFFSNAGIDWHQNLQTKQNVLTHGDLPRCVMDSYEECRGPPRLFLLDKFDVAGAGACLKRYTDPSFFKAEATSTTGVYRERKVRKAKKKGSRWRNGETPEVLPKSHSKLQQLLLEERVENGVSNRTRLVKLERRQLNDPKSGRSYMEKFLGTPSPENKLVRDISVAPLALKWTPDSYTESELEVVDIKIMSSAEKSLEGKGNSLSSSPNHVVVKSTMEGFNGHVNNRRIVPVSELISDGENDEMPSIHPRMVFEKELLVNKGDIKGSIDGENSDKMTSEVENYMDALATMESELDTDNEYISKNYVGFPNAKKGRTDSDGNEEQFKTQVIFSDSQSIGNSSVSNDGNSSFKRGRFSFSCSDTLSNMTENVPSDGEAASNLFPTIETYEEISTSSNKHHAYQEMSDTKPYELEKACDTKLSEVEGMSGMQGDEGKNADLGETDPEPESLIVSLASPAPTTIVQRRIESPSMASDESNSKCLNSEDSNVFSNSSPVSQENSKDMSFEESLQMDHVGETCTQKLVEAKIGSSRSIISPAENKFPLSAELPVENMGSVSEVVTSKGLNLVVDSSEAHSLSKEQFSDSAYNVSMEPEVPHSEEHTNLNCTSVMADGVEIFECHDALDDLQSNPPDDPSCNDHVSSGDIVTETDVGKTVPAVALDAAPQSAAADDNEVVNLPEDLICSSSQELVHLEESLSGSTDSSEELNSNEAFPLQSEVKMEDEVECQQADEASSSSHLLSDQMPPSDHIDQQACFDTSGSFQENLLDQPIASEFSPQSMGQELDHTNRAMESLFSFLPSSDSLPQTSEITANEMPPMPPLPPMLWRMGKVHHVTEDMPGQHSELLFPSMPLFSSHEKAHSGFPAFDSVATLPGNQLTAPEAVEDADPQYVSEELTNHVVQPTPLYEFHDMGDKIPEPGLKLFTTVPVTEDSSSRQDAISSDENLIQPYAEICMEAKTHQRLTNNSEAEHSNHSETTSAPLAREEEEPHLQTLDGQLAWPSNALALAPTFEVEAPNGNTVPKIPHPRSPLVDALAAHDKSMLRKVTDRPRSRPQIEPKDDGRSSFLEQIRTKSFNLKPALVSKPSIEGPKTNLRLAAILEKANAIRQATAGSDEDDEDSWSDE